MHNYYYICTYVCMCIYTSLLKIQLFFKQLHRQQARFEFPTKWRNKYEKKTKKSPLLEKQLNDCTTIDI